MEKKNAIIKIMDTTLRDGEQTKDVSFNAAEKLAIAQMLLKGLNVDFIEACSARVSEGELASVRQIAAWAKANNFLDRVEILGFVDGSASVEWIKEAGCRKINILAKGSERHLRVQLGKTPEEHLKDIEKVVDCGKSEGIKANIYLEDWSNGMSHSKDYVLSFLKGIEGLGLGRIMLPDTLGVLSPKQTHSFVSGLTEQFPKLDFDYHAHNDYGLASANSLAAVEAGAKCIHTTLNGLGERTGNASLAEVVVAINDLTEYTCKVKESMVIEASSLAEKLSLKRVADNKPIVGKVVFTQTAGIHADGDSKGNLYRSRLSAERFGKSTEYSLGKLSGKASLEQNLRLLGIELDREEKKEVLRKVVELGDKKQSITVADLPFIISDVLHRPEAAMIKIKDCVVSSGMESKPAAEVSVEIKGRLYKENAQGNGGYDAFMNAISSICRKAGLKPAKLLDYEVGIPPGGETDALVEAKISWRSNGSSFQTVGVDPDQVMAAVKATEKMLNFVHFGSKGRKQ
jgi:D-citramalate synthase